MEHLTSSSLPDKEMQAYMSRIMPRDGDTDNRPGPSGGSGTCRRGNRRHCIFFVAATLAGSDHEGSRDPYSVHQSIGMTCGEGVCLARTCPPETKAARRVPSSKRTTWTYEGETCHQIRPRRCRTAQLSNNPTTPPVKISPPPVLAPAAGSARFGPASPSQPSSSRHPFRQ